MLVTLSGIVIVAKLLQLSKAFGAKVLVPGLIIYSPDIYSFESIK